MKRIILTYLLSLLSCSFAYAEAQNLSLAKKAKPRVTHSPTTTKKAISSFWDNGDFVFLTGGYWSFGGKSQHINIEGLIGDDFRSQHRYGGNGLVGLGYFINNQLSNRFQISYGINGFYLPKTPLSGTVVQENLFSNLSYGYHVTHYPIYAVAKISTPLITDRMSLAIDVGIGPNFIRTANFAEQSLDGGITLPDPIFSGRTSTTFSATAGIGVRVAEVFGNAPLECGYRFYYLGQGRLRGINTQLINTLHTGSLYGNAVLCALHI